jgi:hypothetical protein
MSVSNMANAEFHYLNPPELPACRECGADQNRDDVENGVCWNCDELSGLGPDIGPDPDDARDRLRDEGF